MSDKKPYGNGSTSLRDFKQISLLGEGAYSAVYKVMRLVDREIYALKKVKLPALSDKERQNALNEVRLLASVRSKYIVAYKEAFFDDTTRCLCIVQELASMGDLFQEITRCQKEKTHMRESDVWRYVHGMCMGLKALHDMKILHRDLKCANVFLAQDKDGVIAKLGDFNVSKVAKRGLCMTQTGTPYYASPEVWRDMPYDAKSDIWSLGCVLYEMVALRPPFRAEDMEGLYRKVLKGQYPRIPSQYSHDLSEAIGTLLQVNPRHRPTVDQLLETPVMRRHSPNNLAGDVISENGYDLLATIKFPKNAIDIGSLLPKPRYEVIREEDPSLSIPGPGDMAAGGAAAQRDAILSKSRGPTAGPIRAAPNSDPYQDGYRLGRRSSHDGDSQSGHGASPGAQHRQGGSDPAVPDSLDAYLQKQSQEPAPARVPTQGTGAAHGHGGIGARYGAHTLGRQESAQGGLRSPALSSTGNQSRSIGQSLLLGQYRQRERDNSSSRSGATGRNMGQYVRQQYMASQPQLPQQQPPPPPSSQGQATPAPQVKQSGSSLRLPRIFTRG
eukprot:TRINITY_DN5903_c0_g3_i1.p1 TRINITY_DN5903_c0_g3~~TRINITY_DN5903_c0_g3_i1.p1  ORF type:complete len:555 (+),score=122.87 TRINITY_DN5903_c0_g3_i1:232-1896(+)